jgi:hypothetical protein
MGSERPHDVSDRSEAGPGGHTVYDDASSETLDVGAGKLPETGFPWEGTTPTPT